MHTHFQLSTVIIFFSPRNSLAVGSHDSEEPKNTQTQKASTEISKLIYKGCSDTLVSAKYFSAFFSCENIHLVGSTPESPRHR